MKTIVKRVALAILAIFAFAAIAAYGASERRLRKTYDIKLTDFQASSGLTAQEDERRARSLMCFGCHRENGNVIFTAPGVGSLVAPNLSRVAATYSDGELERLIRHGIKKDGSGVIAMPSSTFANIADEDLSAIIAWLRSLEVKPDAEPSQTQWGPLGRLALALDKIPYDADHPVKDPAPPKTRPGDIGRYLVSATCAHCHGLQEAKEVEGIEAPALAFVVKTYGLADFTRLMKTGIGLNERELGLMTSVAKTDFSAFTDEEISAIHAFLSSDPR